MEETTFFCLEKPITDNTKWHHERKGKEKNYMDLLGIITHWIRWILMSSVPDLMPALIRWKFWRCSWTHWKGIYKKSHFSWCLYHWSLTFLSYKSKIFNQMKNSRLLVSTSWQILEKCLRISKASLFASLHTDTNTPLRIYLLDILFLLPRWGNKS